MRSVAVVQPCPTITPPQPPRTSHYLAYSPSLSRTSQQSDARQIKDLKFPTLDEADKNHNMDQDAGDPDVPIISIGSISFPAPIITPIVTVALSVITACRKKFLQLTASDSKDASRVERGNSNLSSNTPWVAPNLLWEFRRIAACITPISIAFCLVDFCCSCLPWLPVLVDEPARPPSLSGGGMFGGWLFLLVWVVVASFARDDMRALRPPRETLWRESWFCTDIASRSLAILIAIWTAAWLLRQMGVYLA